jgi:hypothetical protein
MQKRKGILNTRNMKPCWMWNVAFRVFLRNLYSDAMRIHSLGRASQRELRARKREK